MGLESVENTGMPAARTDISLKRLGTVFVASGAMFMTAGNTDVPSMTAGDFGVAAMTEQDAGVAAMTGRDLSWKC